MTRSALYPIFFNMKRRFYFILTQCFSLLFPVAGFSQDNLTEKYNLSLEEVIRLAKKQNNSVQAARYEEQAALEDQKDIDKAALPNVQAGSSYQRFSNLTLFTNGLSHSDSGARRPSSNSANLGIEVTFNIYSGGKQRSLQKEQHSRLKLAQINTMDLSGNTAFYTASQYLELIRLNELQKFISDQLKRAQIRLENIQSLYKNQKVTKSDVLRAQVIVSNVELSLQQNQNDIAIANQKLVVAMNLPDSVTIVPTDSAGVEKPEVESLPALIEKAENSAFIVQKSGENIELQRTKLRTLQSDTMPSLSFYSSYGLNYPNYLFFPSVDQAYSIGFVGLKLHYDISSLYKSKDRITAAKLRVKELELIQQDHRNSVRSEIKAYYIKYNEALNRISVNEKSVEQAKLNYKIVNTKYLNQLSLLTDLLDADHLYQESRLNLVSAQTEALTIYYHILYTSGNL
ncbi:TolC family protein [Chryseobacterium sp. JK1]|uniref:TolC family protein n=1 Tax=Chryseobacterium sp. JK1 TaxID=874294 RepID=UPI003D693B2C